MASASASAPALGVYRTAVHGLPSEVLHLRARVARAARHVLFFPGDVQMRRAEMAADLRGGTDEWQRFSLDDSLPALQAAFGADAHVWCLRPARMVYQFACYQQFASVNLLGAAEYKPDAARAGTGIAAVFAAAAEQAEAAGELRAGEGAALPLALVGFSKGVVVLNQLAAELGAREPAACALVARVAELHFVDGGNGAERGAFPLGAAALDALAGAGTRLRIACHSTPYMLRSAKQPWGAAVEVLDYFAHEPPSLARHFEALGAMRVGGRAGGGAAAAPAAGGGDGPPV
ncbi:hypothetical protein KFE25_005220 [Diacronema lutheri]|uniref:Uncharacterized protein n=1 Tax=Diacronema lutheri TaxID=2081491 RepID=A0A8J5X3Z4_DIALT|nr:hypothetical protein KFE25_005220 [Diacronema lutheri]